MVGDLVKVRSTIIKEVSMNMECNQGENKLSCPCPSDCERSGKCCQCVRHHRVKGQFPACFFSKEALKKGNRSYELLVEDRS